jgi:hypothetical protein
MPATARLVTRMLALGLETPRDDQVVAFAATRELTGDDQAFG